MSVIRITYIGVRTKVILVILKMALRCSTSTRQSSGLLFYFSKLSILFNIRRLTTPAQGWWQTGHWVVLGIICSCFALAIPTTIFERSPVKSHYSLIDLGSLLMTSPKSLHCIDSTKLEFANRWLHVVTDLMLLSVPLNILYKLHMPWSKKLSVGFIFCFGTVCYVASIMRNEV